MITTLVMPFTITEILILTHYSPVLLFYTQSKHDVFGGMEKQHLAAMG